MARIAKRRFTLEEAMADLRAAASPQIATIYQRRNPGIPVLGVRYGDLAKIQKPIGEDAVLASSLLTLALW